MPWPYPPAPLADLPVSEAQTWPWGHRPRASRRGRLRGGPAGKMRGYNALSAYQSGQAFPLPDWPTSISSPAAVTTTSTPTCERARRTVAPAVVWRVGIAPPRALRKQSCSMAGTGGAAQLAKAEHRGGVHRASFLFRAVQFTPVAASVRSPLVHHRRQPPRWGDTPEILSDPPPRKGAPTNHLRRLTDAAKITD